MRKHVLVGAVCALAAALAFGLHDIPVSAWNPATCDFTTGGGYINPTASAAKGNFGVGGGCKNGSGITPPVPPVPYWGHLQYHDHGADKKVHATAITAYVPDAVLFPAPYARLICGTGMMNSTEVDFVVRANDGGELGANKDEFDIIVTPKGGGMPLYTTWTGTPHKLVGGSIQLHKPNRSNTGMFGGECPALPPVGTGSFTLTVTLSSLTGGTGAVTSVPFGINCSVNETNMQSGDCSATFNENTVVELTATSTTLGGSGRFDSGCDDPLQLGTPSCTVTMNNNKTVAATFRGPE